MQWYGFDGERKGFGRDLEKMLILSASDKQADGGTTGKFGLGFKSVLLVCERPRIVSGSIAVEVIAGILPQPWNDYQTARNDLSEYTNEQRLQGTLIELADIEEKQQAMIRDRFRHLAGILAVFARAIRSIKLVNLDEQSFFKWIPHDVVPGVEHGRVILNESGSIQELDALCLRQPGESECLLLVLGPEGFRPLPDYVPAIWVTAPTKDNTHTGFAINGAFELDPGRGNLPAKSEKNNLLAKQIGQKAGKALSELFIESCRDWMRFAGQLNLSAELDAPNFWLSIWQGLTRPWLRKRSNGPALELTRLLVIELLDQLTQVHESIPNGLKSVARKFVSIRNVKYELSDTISSSEKLALLYDWECFAAKYPASTLVSEDMGLILKEVVDDSKFHRIELPALITLVHNQQVRPEDAHVLGQVISREILDELKNSKEVKKEVQDRLSKLAFLSKAGIWSSPAQLMTSDDDSEKDERLRHDLAPQERCLHSDYYSSSSNSPSVEFFRTCRGNLDAPARDIAEWIRDASTDSQKQAGLIYLAKGKLSQEVGDMVRNQSWLCQVLHDTVLLGSLEPDVQKSIKRILATDSQIDRGLQEEILNESRPFFQPKIDLATALKRIESWWSREGSIQDKEYRSRLYPGGSINLSEDPDSGKIDRGSWLTLFALGAFQSIGRTRDEQHRGFISMCQQRGWWNTFSGIDPAKQPDQWMDIIEEYSQNNDEEWTLWIGQFPKLYRLSRWLEDYVDLFKSIDQYDEPFSINQLINPKQNPLYQGGGIEPPNIERALANGVHLVIRELLHYQIIKNPFAVPHAYAPIERIKILFEDFGESVDQSKDIHELLTRHIGKQQAIFDGAYDIPLRIVAGNDELQRKIFS